MKCPYCGKDTKENRCPKCKAEIPVRAPKITPKDEKPKEE